MNKIDFIIASLNNMEDQLSDLNSALGIDKNNSKDRQEQPKDVELDIEIDSKQEPEEKSLEHFTTDYYDTFQNGTPKRTAQNLFL